MDKDLNLPPKDETAENNLIGSMVIDPECIAQVRDIVKPSSFWITTNRWICKALYDLDESGTPINLITLGDRLAKDGKLAEVGGEVALAQLVNLVVTALDAESYARIVAECAKRRGLLSAAGEIAKIAYSTQVKDEDLYAQADQILQDNQDAAQASASDIAEPVTAAAKQMARLEERQANKGKLLLGHPTLLPDLDEMTKGLQATDLIVLAARPSMGKTTLALNLATFSAFKLGLSVAVFSMEMSESQVEDKIVCDVADVALEKIQSGVMSDDEWNRVTAAMKKRANVRLFVDDTPNVTANTIRAKCRKIKRRYGLDLVIVDYLGLMSAEGFKDDNQTGIVTFNSRQLKLLSRQLKVTTLALSQLSRNCEMRSDKRPMLSDLRDSGAVEQDSDKVIFIYRDDYYNADSEMPGISELIVAKNRNGPTGKVTAKFNGRASRFVAIQRLEKVTPIPWGDPEVEDIGK